MAHYRLRPNWLIEDFVLLNELQTYFGPITLNSIIFGLIDRTHTSVEALPRRSSLPALLSIHQCDPNSNHSNIVNHLWRSSSEPQSSEQRANLRGLRGY